MIRSRKSWKKLKKIKEELFQTGYGLRTFLGVRATRPSAVWARDPGCGGLRPRHGGYEARGWVLRCSEISLTPRPARDQHRGHLLYCQRLYLHSAFQWLDLSSFGLFSIDDRAMKIWGRSWTDVKQWWILNGWYLQNICILSRAMDHFVMSSPRPSTDRTARNILVDSEVTEYF